MPEILVFIDTLRFGSIDPRISIFCRYGAVTRRGQSSRFRSLGFGDFAERKQGGLDCERLRGFKSVIWLNSERLRNLVAVVGGRYCSLVVEGPLAMSTLVITPSLADANAGAVCCHRPLQQHQQRDGRSGRGLCLGSTSPPQLSTCAIPHRSSPLGLSRRFVRGSKFTRRSLQRGPRASAETEERPSRADGNGRAAGGLDELDNQLRVLSSSENLLSSAKDAMKGSEEKLPKEDVKKVIWPVFGDGFVLYISAGLILLTILNNILFRVLIGPPVPRDARPQDTGAPAVSLGSQEPNVREEPYKLRSSKDPKYYQNAPPVAENPPGIER